MSKKIWLTLFSALLVAALGGAWLTLDAQAQGGDAFRKPRSGRPAIGQVTSISPSSITIQSLQDQPLTFRMSEDTRFRARGETDPITIDDIQVDDWVGVLPVRRQALGAGETPLARAVVLLPEDFDPEKLHGGRGIVTAVDVADKRFTARNRLGDTITVLVNDATVYKGQVKGLADIQVGMLAGAVTEKQANGDLLASLVRAGFPRLRRAGEVVSVDPAAKQFVLKLRRNGDEITVKVDNETRFRSKDDAVQSLADLKPGMRIATRILRLGENQYLARLALVLPAK